MISRRDALGIFAAAAAFPASLRAQGAAVSDASGEYSIKTKDDGSLILESAKKEVKFRVGKDAFLLRKNSKIELSHDGIATKSLSLLGGGVLAVFGTGYKTINAKTFAAGIRGTGIYIEELSSDTVYSCLCYGQIEYRHPKTNEIALAIKSIHHDKPVAISKASDGRLEYFTDKRENHTDDELRALEKMCGREVPFEEWLMLNGDNAYGH